MWIHSRNRPPAKPQRRANRLTIEKMSGSRQAEFLLQRHVLAGMAVRAPRIAGLCAVPEGIIDYGLDRARATTAFGAAAEAVIDLLGTARQIVLRRADGKADIVVADDVAGTNNHEGTRTPVKRRHRYVRARWDAKGKAGF